MSEDVIYFRWYNERLNQKYFDELKKSVADCTDLTLRRKDARISNAYHDIDSKLDQICYHCSIIFERIKLSNEILPNMLSDLSKEMVQYFKLRSSIPKKNDMYAEFYDYILNSHIEALLIQVKALLDSTAQFYSIAFNRDVRSFSKSGKNWINDINNLPETETIYIIELCKFIKNAKELWIDELIRYRDEVVHFGQLRKMRGLLVKLENKHIYDVKEVKQPSMPNKILINEYTSMVLHESHKFEIAMMTIFFKRLLQP